MKILRCLYPPRSYLPSRAWLVISSIFVLSTSSHADSTVTVTQQVPIETISADGTVIGVKESAVGTKLTLVSAEGGHVTLQDAGGIHYRIAVASTDYVAPAAAISAPVNNLSEVKPPATNSPPPPIPPATASLPTITNTMPPATPPPVVQEPAPDSAVKIVNIEDRSEANRMAVWPPGGIAGRPLLIAAHGNGGSGPGEIKGWLDFAQKHRFTIVCPTFLSSVNSIYLSEDAPYFRTCLRWIGDNLQYDKDNVYMTGMSGGGFPTWYLATQRPEFFRGIFLQSCNFAGDYFGLNLNKWYKKPIKLIWGSRDLKDIPIENQQAVEMLKAADCKNFTTEVIQGAGHQPHHDLVVAWMEQQMASSPSN